MSVGLEHNKLKNVVESVLYADELARSNDDRLYYAVLRSISSDKGINLDQITAPNFFLMRKRNGFPAYTSVVRERRRIQADNSVLQADPNVEAMRELREEDYKEWAVRRH